VASAMDVLSPRVTFVGSIAGCGEGGAGQYLQCCDESTKDKE